MLHARNIAEILKGKDLRKGKVYTVYIKLIVIMCISWSKSTDFREKNKNSLSKSVTFPKRIRRQNYELFIVLYKKKRGRGEEGDIVFKPNLLNRCWTFCMSASLYTRCFQIDILRNPKLLDAGINLGTHVPSQELYDPFWFWSNGVKGQTTMNINL